MPLLFVLEDDHSYFPIVDDVGRRAGFSEFELNDNIQETRAYLDRALQGLSPLPDAMIVDLDLGQESGFELLKFWHSTPSVRAIPVIIWSVLGTKEQEICALFKVDRFVSKHDGANALFEALSAICKK